MDGFGGVVISIDPVIFVPVSDGVCFHRHIRITDNVFDYFDRQRRWARLTGDLLFADKTIVTSFHSSIPTGTPSP